MNQRIRRRPNRAEKREANRTRILRAAREVFGARGFHAATIEEIADEAGLPLQQAIEVRAAARASTSLDQPIGEQEDAVFGDLVAGDDPLPDEVTEKRLQKEALDRALESLPERDRRVLELRYGLRGEEPHTLEHIGRRLGITRERVRQIEIESLSRLASLREIDAVATH